MSKFLFNNSAFPILSEPNILSKTLEGLHVRAVSYRVPEISSVMQMAARTIDFRPNPEKTQAFLADPNGERTRYPGQTPYYRPLSGDDIIFEAQESGIVMPQEPSIILAERMNALKELFTNTYRDFSGDHDTPIVGNVLIVPTGMSARAAIPHADNVRLTGHWSSAPLDVLTEEPDEILWAALDRQRRDQLPKAEQEKILRWLEANVPEWQDNYMYSESGDFLIMKGQKGRDLRTEEDQGQVCVHKSSALLPLTGQIGFVCYPKTPTPEPEMH